MAMYTKKSGVDYILKVHSYFAWNWNFVYYNPQSTLSFIQYCYKRVSLYILPIELTSFTIQAIQVVIIKCTKFDEKFVNFTFYRTFFSFKMLEPSTPPLRFTGWKKRVKFSNGTSAFNIIQTKPTNLVLLQKRCCHKLVKAPVHTVAKPMLLCILVTFFLCFHRKVQFEEKSCGKMTSSPNFLSTSSTILLCFGYEAIHLNSTM